MYMSHTTYPFNNRIERYYPPLQLSKFQLIIRTLEITQKSEPLKWCQNLDAKNTLIIDQKPYYQIF